MIIRDIKTSRAEHCFARLAVSEGVMSVEDGDLVDLEVLDLQLNELVAGIEVEIGRT